MNIIFNEVKNRNLEIDIVGTIGTSFFEETFNSGELKSKLDQNIDNYDTIILNISSLGGSAYEGLNIYSLLEFQKSKGKKIVSNIIGAVASAAVTISLAGDERNIMENSLMLIHKVSGSVEGKKEEIEEHLKQMNALNTNLVDIYSSRTGLPKQEISDLMDQEKWLSSKESMKYNLVTNIIKEKKVKNKLIDMESIINQINESDLPKIEQEVITETIENKVVEPVEQTEVTNEVKETIENEVIEPTIEIENKVEDTIVDKVEDITNIKDIDNLKLEINTKNDQILNLSNQVDTLSVKIKELEKTIKDKEIEDILNVAIKQNKISNSLKENYKNLLNVDFELTSQLISKLIPNKVVSLVDLITEEESTNPRIDWTIRDWERQDPNGLRELKSNDPEKYNKLFNSFYKK